MATRLFEPFTQFLDSAGDPLNGGKLYFYETGTSTKKDTYTTSALSVANTNPIVLDAYGRASVDIWGNGEYKVVRGTSAGTTTTPADPLTADPLLGFDISGINIYTNIAAMTAILKSTLTTNDTVDVSGYTTQGGGGGGRFYWDSTSTATANGGTIIASDEGGTGRWLRIFDIIRAVDFGADTTGTTASDTEFQAFVSETRGKHIVGQVGDIIKLTTRITMPTDIDIDLGGCTIKCELGSLNLFDSTELTKATYTVTTQTALSDTVVLSAPPAGLSVGDRVSFSATDIAGRWPISLRRVEAIVSATITLDSQLDFAYTGTITMSRRPFNGRIAIYNGIIDGSTTTAANQVSFLKDYEEEIWRDITFQNFDLGVVSARNIVVSYYAKKFLMENCHFNNIIVNGQYASIFYAARGTIADNDSADTNAFGFAFSNSDDVSLDTNKIRASFQSGGAVSTRGMKIVGCFGYHVNNNTIREFDSGIKVEDSGGGVVVANTLRNNNTSINISNQNPVTAYHHSDTINGNSIFANQNVNGAISVQASSNAAIVSNNNLYDCQGVGIICNADEYTIDGNNFHEWSLAAVATHRAISCGNALLTSSVRGNNLYTADPSNLGIGIGVGSTNVRFSSNNHNNTILYDSIPVIPAEITTELENGTFMKVLTVTTVTTGFEDFTFTTPFQNGIQSAVATCDDGANTTNVVVNMAGSNKTKIRLATSVTTTVVNVVCIGN